MRALPGRSTSRRTPYRTRYLSVLCAHPGQPDSHFSKAQVSKRQQGVVGVFTVSGIIRPVSVEAAPVRPESIDEVETGLPQVSERRVQARQGMKRRGCREQIGNRRLRRGKESTLGAAPGKKPLPEF